MVHERVFGNGDRQSRPAMNAAEKKPVAISNHVSVESVVPCVPSGIGSPLLNTTFALESEDSSFNA